MKELKFNKFKELQELNECELIITIQEVFYYDITLQWNSAIESSIHVYYI